ncbi:hypothetical protein PPYR_00883 [Photinus pyralis]|uniref:Uncharacterized protein n=1 Tax=Photinus pyralis TaxID=7054 RepID=A0A1Y1KU00_PHOPY|nr:uncharacterized protein LOC116159942 [Photinus pyralis]KAB0803913.1 hypothetical protein PPYR_00883 [Photinus pyralis]
MEWFGITMYGYPDPLKAYMRDDYVEPEVQPTVYEQLAKGTKKQFADLLATIDVYIGRADGYSYKSIDRYKRMKRRGVPKPVAPNEMYSHPLTTAMETSFWTNDPELQDADWYKKRSYQPKPSTDIGRFVEAAKKIDKFFKL